MRVKRIAAFCLILLLALALRGQQNPPHSSTLAITHVTVIDTTGGLPRKAMTVVISGGKIAAFGEDGRVQIPKGAQLVDARDKFLIPGLWDMHVHLAGVSALPSWSKTVLLPLLVANGITGVRDMGGDLDALREWRKEIEKGELLGPELVAAGPMLLPARPDGSPPAKPDPAVLRVGTADEARAAVRTLKERGADFVKVIDLPREAYFAAADEAKKQGMVFVGHVPSRVTAAEASQTGQKSIEHIVYSSIAFDCSSRSEELRKKRAELAQKRDFDGLARLADEANQSFDPARAAALWKIFIQNGTWETPTLESIHANAHHLEDSPADPGLTFLPRSLRAEWAPKKEITQDNRDTDAWWQRQFENDLKLTREMHRAGVRILAGSDSLDRYVFVGSSLHRELQWLVKAGFTPMEALQAATKAPAEFLGRNDFGSVAAGKRADLVLLDADPLADISNTQKIFAVVLNGNLLTRRELDALLAKAKEAAAAAQ